MHCQACNAPLQGERKRRYCDDPTCRRRRAVAAQIEHSDRRRQTTRRKKRAKPPKWADIPDGRKCTSQRIEITHVSCSQNSRVRTLMKAFSGQCRSTSSAVTVSMSLQRSRPIFWPRSARPNVARFLVASPRSLAHRIMPSWSIHTRHGSIASCPVLRTNVRSKSRWSPRATRSAWPRR